MKCDFFRPVFAAIPAVFIHCLCSVIMAEGGECMGVFIYKQKKIRTSSCRTLVISTRMRSGRFVKEFPRVEMQYCIFPPKIGRVFVSS